MKKYVVTYDHYVYRPSTYEQLKQQEEFEEFIFAFSLEEAKEIFKRTFNKNPFYFKFTESNK